MRRPAHSRVAILRASAYDAKLEEILMQGLRLFGLDLSNRSVLLKPNLVDYIPGDAINTHPLMVTVAVECFRRLGARRVVVAEGPGHRRDTHLLLSDRGYAERLKGQKVVLVVLNRYELWK